MALIREATEDDNAIMFPVFVTVLVDCRRASAVVIMSIAAIPTAAATAIFCCCSMLIAV